LRSEGRLFGYEMTWNPSRKKKVPSEWTSAYPDAGFQVVHPNDFLAFIS
jgi:hypothetical protein